MCVNMTNQNWPQIILLIPNDASIFNNIAEKIIPWLLRISRMNYIHDSNQLESHTRAYEYDVREHLLVKHNE